MTLSNEDNRKKSFLEKMFLLRDPNERKARKTPLDSPEVHSDSAIHSLFSNCLNNPMPTSKTQSFRAFVATWNVGGKSPNDAVNLDDFLRIDNQADIYVLGFQEIVPLNAGNVLVVEDNEPAAKWLSLIDQSLNRSRSMGSSGRKSSSPLGSSLLFQKPSLKKVCKNFRTESKRRLKTCNCSDILLQSKHGNDFCLWPPPTNMSENELSLEIIDDGLDSYVSSEISTNGVNQQKYSLIVGKQMVGIFLTIWIRNELVQYVSHLRISCIGRGILGRFGNKGCISVSMCFHQTSFCFVCSHLASGEKEGDEVRRNMDVIEILKNTQFQRICRSAYSRVPEKIIEHDRVIWLGDLNYRIALSYSEAKRLVERYDWNALLDKDQLKIEKEAGRVFWGWKEGKICFAPTYKYSHNSDVYAGEATEDSKNKRRRPACRCDRILWRGSGIHQVSYLRWESRHHLRHNQTKKLMAEKNGALRILQYSTNIDVLFLLILLC
ncbi:type I inositol polyphosphate 5-phosphatase 10 isoform X3 [Euphorbia lathyris]|uniref:type I inositol polyphosphate 5-phosphatase 10 isoform X3 n=1 Tax=Euphorbia lathyris TaxID=212925 RepID=UPI0033138B2F